MTPSCKFNGSERLEGDVNCKEHDAFSDLEDHVEEEHLGEYFVESFEEDRVVFVPFTCKLVDSTSPESSKSKFLEFETFMTEDFDLDQTLEHTEISRLEDLGPISLLRQLFHDNKLCRLMTLLLGDYEYVCLFDVWAQNFDRLK